MFILIFLVHLLIIPKIVESQCFSESSEKWFCDGRKQGNNFNYQEILSKNNFIEMKLTNFKLDDFRIDFYSTNLHLINASGNDFKRIIITGSLRSNSNLKQLILQSNQLEDFSIETIVLPESLEKISLANNFLRIIDARLFSNLMNLKEIDLRNNLLKRVYPQLVIDRVVLLDSNPLDCRCTTEAYRTICEKATTIKRSQTEQNNCLAPYYNPKLNDFQPESFLRFSTFTLICPISGRPPPIIVWSTPFGNLTSINSTNVDLLFSQSQDEPFYVTLTAYAGPLTARTQHTLHSFNANQLSVTTARAALQHRITCSGINMLGNYTYEFNFDIETYVLGRALWQIIFTSAFGFFLSLIAGALCVTLKRTYNNCDDLKTPPIYPTMAPNSAARTPPNFELNQWLSLAAANISGTLEQVRDKLRMGVQQVSEHMGQTMGRATELFNYGVQHAGGTIRQAAETSAAYLHSFRESSQQRFNTMRVQTLSSIRNPGNLMRAGMNIITTQVNSLRDYCGVITGHPVPTNYLYQQQSQQIHDLRYSPAPNYQTRPNVISTISEEDETFGESTSLMASLTQVPYVGFTATAVAGNASGIGQLGTASSSALAALDSLKTGSDQDISNDQHVAAAGQMSGGIGIFQGRFHDHDDDLINEPSKLIIYGEQRPNS